MEIKAGNILISEPFLQDDNFLRTVVLITIHDSTGSVGLVLNDISDFVLPDLVEAAILPHQVNLGGPVSRNMLFFLHTVSEISNSLEVLPNVYWGGDAKEIDNYLQKGLFNEHNFRCYLGYSGWDDGQLKMELTQKSWVLAPGKKEYIFDENNLWKRALTDLGREYSVLANAPKDVRSN